MSNYRMPAEWEPHERTILSWPVAEAMVWPENYQELCAGYAAVVKAILPFEPVSVIVNAYTEMDARSHCGEEADYIVIPHNDAWARDNGPTFVRDTDEQLLGVSWKFNAWGEKYSPYDLDDQVAPIFLEKMGVSCVQSDIVLEGGSIHVDGEGTLLTTEECLLNPNRNPHLSRDEITVEVMQKLGVESVIWLPHGLFGDETDGHIDNIACFATPGVVLLQTCTDESDPNYGITQEALSVLNTTKDAKGRALQVIAIPQPPMRFYKEERLTLSYLNFYIVNGAIILPVFGGDAAEADKQAIATLAGIFPDRKIVPVDGMPLIKEGGNVHCITQQMPRRA